MKETRICQECGKTYEARTVIQRYCSKRCNVKASQRRAKEGLVSVYPSVTFECANTKYHRIVVTDGFRDKRTRFCCQTCEKVFWRHQYKLLNGQHQTQTNFASIEQYAEWEQRTNREA